MLVVSAEFLKGPEEQGKKEDNREEDDNEAKEAQCQAKPPAAVKGLLWGWPEQKREPP